MFIFRYSTKLAYFTLDKEKQQIFWNMAFRASTPETVCMVVWNDGMITSGEVEIKAESIMQKLIADNKRFIKLLNYNTLLQTG